VPPALGAALLFMASRLMRALLPNPLVDFLSVNLDVLWRIDSDTNLSAFLDVLPPNYSVWIAIETAK
jgi:hypothetical protein